MNKLLLVLLFPLASFAQLAAQPFQLKGHLALNKQVDWVYLRYAAGEQVVFDSIQPKNGLFAFSGQLPEPVTGSLTVKFVPEPGQQRPARQGMELLLEPGTIALEAKDSLDNHTVTGTPGQADFAALARQQAPYDAQLTQLYGTYNEYRKQGNQEGMKQTEASVDSLQKIADESVYGSFVRKHPNSPVALYALKQYAGWDIDADKIEPLYKALPAATKQWPSAVALNERIGIARKTGIGKYAMDFTQNDTSGHAVSLSSFKGKYLLVDFWASWCGPCRQENPNVVKAYNKYKDRNFTILGVSLDRPNGRERWLKAIHDDGLTWNHVSDLKYWDNDVAKLYGIRAIPQNLLLDPQGKIIAKNLSGEELDRKLAEVLGR